MTDSTTALRRAIEVHLARRRTSGRRLGQEALGDPGFVAALGRGRSPRLDTADRMLVHLGLAPIGPRFRREVEAFLAVTRTKRSIFGHEAAGAPSFVARLRRGASPRLATVDRVCAWMAAHASEDEYRAIRAEAAVRRIPSPIDETGECTVSDSIPRYLSTREAASVLRLSARTLDRYRVSGEGPAFHKFGARVCYARADLDAWAASRRRASTSDPGGAVAARR